MFEFLVDRVKFLVGANTSLSVMGALRALPSKYFLHAAHQGLTSSPESPAIQGLTNCSNYVLIILDLKLHTWGFEIWVGTNMPVNCIMSIFGSSIFSFSASKKYPDFCSCSAGESVFAWLWFEIWVGNWAQICSPLNATRMSSSQLSSLEKCAAKSSKLLQISRANK